MTALNRPADDARALLADAAEALRLALEAVAEDSAPALDLAPADVAELGRPPAAAETAAARLESIAERVLQCRACRLHAGRRHTVPGQGNTAPAVLFVGEAPGAEEDRQGLAFVGEAGGILTRIVKAMGFTRDEVFIANVIKCRPPDNRPPQPDEMAACLPFLRAQVKVLRPRVIVALGAIAATALLGPGRRIGELRGHWAQFDGIDLMPTYHPSYLLRDVPPHRRYHEVWADMQKVLDRLGRKPPPRPVPGAPAGR